MGRGKNRLRNCKCGEPAFRKGLCLTHYEKMKKKCRIEGCENFSRTQQLCLKHYYRVKRTGNPEVVRTRGRRSRMAYKLKPFVASDFLSEFGEESSCNSPSRGYSDRETSEFSEQEEAYGCMSPVLEEMDKNKLPELEPRIGADAWGSGIKT